MLLVSYNVCVEYGSVHSVCGVYCVCSMGNVCNVCDLHWFGKHRVKSAESNSFLSHKVPTQSAT